jgi:hypothetical protein
MGNYFRYVVYRGNVFESLILVLSSISLEGNDTGNHISQREVMRRARDEQGTRARQRHMLIGSRHMLFNCTPLLCTARLLDNDVRED